MKTRILLALVVAVAALSGCATTGDYRPARAGYYYGNSYYQRAPIRGYGGGRGFGYGRGFGFGRGIRNGHGHGGRRGGHRR